MLRNADPIYKIISMSKDDFLQILEFIDLHFVDFSQVLYEKKVNLKLAENHFAKKCAQTDNFSRARVHRDTNQSAAFRRPRKIYISIF